MTDQDKNRFVAATVALYKTFNRPSDIDITRVLYQTLVHLAVDDAEKVIELAIIHGESFPTPAALRRYVSMIPPKPVPRLQHNRGHNQELADDASKLVQLALTGKLNHEQLVEGMTVMDRKYPGIGWNHEAALLVGYYRQQEEQHDQTTLDLVPDF